MQDTERSLYLIFIYETCLAKIKENKSFCCLEKKIRNSSWSYFLECNAMLKAVKSFVVPVAVQHLPVLVVHDLLHHLLLARVCCLKISPR